MEIQVIHQLLSFCLVKIYLVLVINHSTSHNTILNQVELSQLAKSLAQACNGRPDDDVILLDDSHLHLPAMIFGCDYLSISQSVAEGGRDGCTILFDASDALLEWCMQVMK